MARVNGFTYSLKKLTGNGDLQHTDTAGANNNQEWTSSTRTQCLRISLVLYLHYFCNKFIIAVVRRDHASEWPHYHDRYYRQIQQLHQSVLIPCDEQMKIVQWLQWFIDCLSSIPFWCFPVQVQGRSKFFEEGFWSTPTSPCRNPQCQQLDCQLFNKMHIMKDV